MGEKLDSKLCKLATKEKVESLYYEYKHLKTDLFYDPPKIRIKMGVDGVDWENFEKNLERSCNNISNRVKDGRYFFKPFRETHIEKGTNSKEYRVISIATISDMIVQKLIHECIYSRAESVFCEIDEVSFAYRIGRSAPQAAKQLRKYINQGYIYVFDADIRKFFDTIPHELLKEKLLSFFGKENELIYKYLKRFISVDRVRQTDYKYKPGRENIYKRKKPERISRSKGIPQGGVISGLVANIYMHEFDEWILKILREKYDIKYIRYADDFLVLFKDKGIEKKIEKEIDGKLKELGLSLNTDKTDTLIDLSIKGNSVQYVGCSISKTDIRIKKENIDMFKEKVTRILKKTQFQDYKDYTLKLLISRLTFKFRGNETLGLKRCKICGLDEARRSWINYFSIVTDIQQIRSLDTWIRKQIYYWYYKQTNKRLNLFELKSNGFIRLEEVYREIKKQKNTKGICRCKPLQANQNREHLLEILFHHSS